MTVSKQSQDGSEFHPDSELFKKKYIKIGL